MAGSMLFEVSVKKAHKILSETPADVGKERCQGAHCSLLVHIWASIFCASLQNAKSLAACTTITSHLFKAFLASICVMHQLQSRQDVLESPRSYPTHCRILIDSSLVLRLAWWICRVQQSIIEQGNSTGLLSTLRKAVTRSNLEPVSRTLQVNVNDNTLKSLADESVKDSYKVSQSPSADSLPTISSGSSQLFQGSTATEAFQCGYNDNMSLNSSACDLSLGKFQMEW